LSDRSAFLAGMRIALLLVALLFLLGSVLTSISRPTNSLTHPIMSGETPGTDGDERGVS